jgi:hypothetical protein
MGKLFDQLIILQQQRAARPCRNGVLIVGNGIATGGGHYSLFAVHGCPPLLFDFFTRSFLRMKKKLSTVLANASF